MQNALEIRNLTKRYVDFTLDNLTLSLPSGCIMGFIGENGAGKSTTIKLILDLIQRDEGETFILGQDIQTADKQIKEEIGVVMDECCFPENLNIKEINKIMETIYKTWDAAVFHQYIKQFSLSEKKAVKDFSRGMKMKLSLAVALSHNPKILILDEATSGLDPIVRDELLHIFLEFIQDENHTIFLSSHILSDLEKACDYITFIHKGKLIFSQPKDDLLDNYGMLKCSDWDFSTIDKTAVIGSHKNSFGVEALVLKNKVPSHLVMDRATIEDIMLYHIKENM